MSLQPRDDREARFAQYLLALANNDNRAALAALRRGLSAAGTVAATMHRYVAGWLVDQDRQSDEECFYLVAALFGRYPSTADAPGNFGASCHEFQVRRASDSFERRFVALLAADPASVGVHLRHAVSLLASESVPVDWAQLLRDLRWWGQSERRVQRKWAREFWKHTETPATGDQPAEAIGQQV